MGKAFEQMMAGVEDAIAYAQGDMTRGRVANPPRTRPFDAAKHFATPEAQADLIADAVKSGHPGYLSAAITTVARARGEGIMTDPPTAGLRPTHPGEFLREIILPAVAPGKAEIARMLGISRQQLYDILGEKPVTPRTALRLAKLFGGEADFWLKMQMDHDLCVERQAMADELARIPELRAVDGSGLT